MAESVTIPGQGTSPGIEVIILPSTDPDIPCQALWWNFESMGYKACGQPSAVRLRITCEDGCGYLTFNCQKCHEHLSQSDNVTCRMCNAWVSGWRET